MRTLVSCTPAGWAGARESAAAAARAMNMALILCGCGKRFPVPVSTPYCGPRPRLRPGETGTLDGVAEGGSRATLTTDSLQFAGKLKWRPLYFFLAESALPSSALIHGRLSLCSFGGCHGRAAAPPLDPRRKMGKQRLLRFHPGWPSAAI